MAKNLRKPKTGVKNPAVAALLLSFGCGVGVCILLLALAAFLLTHTGLPLSAVRPMACMAAAVGAAVSAAVLARRLRKRLLLCGLGCGAFYAVCLLAATLLANGRLDWQGSNAMLPLALLLGGLLGGALTALRAAQTALRRPGLPMLRPAVERPHREHTPQTESGAALAFGVIFLASYLPGIWLGRSGTTPLGQQLAAYYTSRPEGTSLAAAFGAQLAVSLLQLILVLLCGFCVWGVGLLTLLFAARGLFLGFCAASVAAQSGASALLRYRLDTLLSDVGTLLLCLWLAGWAVRLAMELFRAVRGRAARETPGTARRLAVRFAAALALSAAFAAVGVVFTVIGIGGVGC